MPERQAPDAKPFDLLGKEHFEVDLYVDLYDICMIAICKIWKIISKSTGHFKIAMKNRLGVL
jgi:hypothetical protein